MHTSTTYNGPQKNFSPTTSVLPSSISSLKALDTAKQMGRDHRTVKNLEPDTNKRCVVRTSGWPLRLRLQR